MLDLSISRVSMIADRRNISLPMPRKVETDDAEPDSL